MAHVRVMFWIYVVLIVTGLVLYTIVGLSHN
jgi:hypothetical protein